MKKTVRTIAIAITLLYITVCLCGCSQREGSSADRGENLQIVATVFPSWDWARNVLGSNPAGAELSLLIDNGADLHSYQPTAADMLKISKCDLFICIGGESEEWVDDAMKNATNKDMVVVSLLEALGDDAMEEEIVEGMQVSDHDHDDHGDDHDEHDDDHDDNDESHHHSGETEYDEHVWLSLKNASKLTSSICEALKKVDPKNSSTYDANAREYISKLDALDGEYTTAVKDAKVSTLLFGDRFPFRYLVEDYGLKYYAAFAGCSAETEANFETITFLAEKADELSLGSVLTIEGSDGRIAKTIIDNTRNKDRKILTLDSLQSVTTARIESGLTYLSAMKDNLSVLKEALT